MSLQTLFLLLNYFHTRLFYVNMQDDYVEMQHYYVNMQK